MIKYLFSKLVTDSSKNPKVLEGYEVFDIDSLASNEYKENALFIVAIMFPTAERVQIQHNHAMYIYNIVLVFF